MLSLGYQDISKVADVRYAQDVNGFNVLELYPLVHILFTMMFALGQGWKGDLIHALIICFFSVEKLSLSHLCIRCGFHSYSRHVTELPVT